MGRAISHDAAFDEWEAVTAVGWALEKGHSDLAHPRRCARKKRHFTRSPFFSLLGVSSVVLHFLRENRTTLLTPSIHFGPAKTYRI